MFCHILPPLTDAPRDSPTWLAPSRTGARCWQHLRWQLGVITYKVFAMAFRTECDHGSKNQYVGSLKTGQSPCITEVVAQRVLDSACAGGKQNTELISKPRK